MVEDAGENYLTGWVKLFRSIRKHWIWVDPIRLKQWLDIILEVNHDDKKIAIGYELIECKRGQSIMSLQSWAKRWNVSKSSARRFLELLQKDKMIVMENVTKTTRITVCNYESYQGNGHVAETMVKRSRNDGETMVDPNKNDKNVNNDKNYKKKNSKNKFLPPTLLEFQNYFKDNGYNIDVAERAWKGYDVANWHDSNGNPVRNWKQKCIYVWFKDENKTKESLSEQINKLHA